MPKLHDLVICFPTTYIGSLKVFIVAVGKFYHFDIFRPAFEFEPFFRFTCKIDFLVKDDFWMLHSMNF